ncbi:MAG: hypothetical protein LBH80_04655 [Prevotellaceae bacterium]|jgi:hypothetical protein|nr:hypothetical protein [Prevotellaceae bacterium]
MSGLFNRFFDSAKKVGKSEVLITFPPEISIAHTIKHPANMPRQTKNTFGHFPLEREKDN